MRRMGWQQSFRVRKYVRESLWLVPALSVLIGAGLGIIDVAFIEPHVNVPDSWQYSPGTASTILSDVVAALAGLTGIVVAVAVLIIQMATGTLSPRYMRVWFRNRLQKAAFAGFLGTMGFAYSLLRHSGTGHVPDLGVTLTGLAVFISMVLFLRYIDRFARLLRPVGLAAYVADAGVKVFQNELIALQGAGVDALDSGHGAAASVVPDGQPSQAVRSERSGAVQAVNERGLVELAQRHDSVIVLHRHIGDFVAEGDTMVEVFRSGPDPSDDLIRRAFVLGVERAFEQDPAFALRIIVDIDIRALSPAVNDPTTGVQLLDYVERMLRVIGEFELAERHVLRDRRGQPRVVFASRSWEDYLTLGVTEIREYGATSTQITRRLRALLKGLLGSVHPSNREAVRSQLTLLDAALDDEVPDKVRREYASRADSQGLGGPEPLDGQSAQTLVERT